MFNINNIIKAAKDNKADAVHPGYGFLSENAEFSKALKKDKITFIGPSMEAIQSMGDKIISKRIAKKAGVNIIPGVDGAIKNVDIAIKAAKEIGTYLALSLHAPNNKIRDSIMPINKKYNIEDVINHCKEYAIENKEKIFIEYVLLKDVNDSEECAKQLSKIMSKFPCKLNLIQFNPWPGVKYKTSSVEQTSKFINIIKNNGHIVTLRKSRGNDILGACGQLKTASEREKRVI